VAIGSALVPFFTTRQCVCVTFAGIRANVCLGTCVIMSMSVGMSVTVPCTSFSMVALGILSFTCAATSGLCVLGTFRLSGLSRLGGFFLRCSYSFFGIHCTSFCSFHTVNSGFLYRGNGFGGGLCSGNAECA